MSMTLLGGESIVIVGPSGTGKSDAARFIGGLSSEEAGARRVWLSDEDLYACSPLRRAESIALVPSNPELLFSCISKSLQREMELSFEFLGRSAEADKIASVLDGLALDNLVSRDPMTFSGGEKVRAAIALAVVKDPRVLVIDDVFEQLDPASESLIRTRLCEAREDNGLILIEFHSKVRAIVEDGAQQWAFICPEELVTGQFVDCWERVEARAPELFPPLPELAARLRKANRAVYSSPPLSASAVAAPLKTKEFYWDTASRDAGDSSAEAPTNYAIEVAGLGFRYSGNDSFRLGPISHRFPTGKTTAILGKNGSGKTTFLRCLGNLNTGWQGTIRVGREGPRPSAPLHEWARSIIYCFQDPDDQLFLPTVRAELLETARHTRPGDFPGEDKMREVSERLGLTSSLNQSPFELPRSMKRLLTLASAFVATPPVLLLDEPTAMLDRRQADSITRLLRHFLEQGGTAIVVSHDFDFVSEVVDEFIVLGDGQVEATASKNEYFTAWPGRALPAVPAVARELEIPRPVWRVGDLIEMTRPRS